MKDFGKIGLAVGRADCEGGIVEAEMPVARFRQLCVREVRACVLLIPTHGEGNGHLLQYSCLENPMDGGAW